MYEDFITLDTLTTFAGIVAATTLIVQFTKSLIKKKFQDVAIRIYTWIVALILMIVFVGYGKGMQGIVLTVINSIIVALTSMGTYEVIADPLAEKKKK